MLPAVWAELMKGSWKICPKAYPEALNPKSTTSAGGFEFFGPRASRIVIFQRYVAFEGIGAVWFYPSVLPGLTFSIQIAG